jgi:PIN domain nuclease of toxin-antitoxin system
MKLLLDTHIALWWVTGDASLSGDVVAMIESAEHDVYVSVASIWEIAIKYARPKGRPDDMPLSGREALAEFERAGADILPVTAAHAAAVDDLPALHGDPFDRMLIAQALAEPLRLLTRDARLAEYSKLVMLA